MLLLAPILAIGLSLSPPPDTTRSRWTLAEYLALVEASNPELLAARERVTAAEARVGPARRPPDPMVEFGVMNRSLPRFGRNSPVAMDQVRISQPIPVPGTLGAAVSAARKRATADGGALEETRRRVRWQATADLITVDRLDHTASLLASFASVLKSLGDVARSRYAVGQAEQTDVIRAQLETARFDEELITLRTDRQAAVARLNAIALRPPLARIDTIILPAPLDSLPSVTDLVNRSVRERPLLASRRAGLEAAGFDRRRSELERWPDVEVGLVYGQQPMVGGGTDRMVSMMIGARVPIWSGSRQRQMVREGQAMERLAAAEIASTEAMTQAQVGQLAALVDRASSLTALYRGTLVPQTRAAAAASLASYRVGMVDFEAAMGAQLAVIRAELQILSLAAGRANAIAELDYLTALSLGTDPEGGSR